ncbi:uncharacterized protein G2W53_019120 [Senna tora]|uniref:Uncharacterized protein n=1 Tax=Senna tora TaxID=362788 RepID=A0A834TWE0_9FABA|nr:uncharacterized protein G2W53_019120 [Senna tora]
MHDIQERKISNSQRHPDKKRLVVMTKTEAKTP